MKKSFGALLLVFVASVALADELSEILTSSVDFGKVSEEKLALSENGGKQLIDPSYAVKAPRGWILNNEGKKALQNIILTLPCGWPEYGIPPLAPYTNEELIIDLKKSFIETFTKLIRLRVDGLDILLINKLKIGYVWGKKVKYSITFPKIIITGKIVTDTWLDLTKEYGIKVRYDGKGPFELILDNILIEGSFQYKMPFIFGSIKIYNFICQISLGKVMSNIELMGHGILNRLLNEKIEDYLWKAVNYNKNEIGSKIEETVVPFVNKKMKGHKVWYVIGKLGGKSEKCYPPSDPWALNSTKVL